MIFLQNALINIGNAIKSKNYLSLNPSFCYAELTILKDFCKICNINLNDVVAKLKLKDFKFKNSNMLKDIYKIIKQKKLISLCLEIAQKSLQDLKEQYDINFKLINYLKLYDIDAFKDITFKKLAKQNKLHPAILYNMLFWASQK
jgi:uncharacterized protein YfkK (UPF0435 family)